MLVRIVKMTFKKEHIADFKEIFNQNKENIKAFDGCSFLELYQDKTNKAIFFTYSYWNDETFLERYRNSDFFKSVWTKTKVLFASRPEAWSVDKIETLK